MTTATILVKEMEMRVRAVPVRERQLAKDTLEIEVDGFTKMKTLKQPFNRTSPILNGNSSKRIILISNAFSNINCSFCRLIS